MNKTKIIYYISTGLLSLLMLFSAGMYIFNNAEVAKLIISLGYPPYILYPLAAAKILGLIAIWSDYSKTLKEWAYAGFFYDFILALSAHLSVGDGEFGGALVALVLWLGSYISYKRLITDN